jgi:phosphoglycolate phosphatase
MVLLFDLDGTLTDSRPGILGCMRYALDALGIKPPSDDALSQFIGPPTHDAFRALLGPSNASLQTRAIELYRERFSTIGMFENRVYPGIREGLTALRAVGVRLWVATSKPRVYLDHSTVWMVGDRMHDVGGAHRNGLRAAGVLWGYGSRSELTAAGADLLVVSMPELIAALT